MPSNSPVEVGSGALVIAAALAAEAVRVAIRQRGDQGVGARSRGTRRPDTGWTSLSQER
jgi:hypothetical protein